MLGAAKVALTAVRKTGKYLDTKVDSSDFKNAARMVYNRGGSSDLGKFLSNSVDTAGAGVGSILADAKYGFDEVSWPKGAAKLPKGVLGKGSNPPFPSRKGSPLPALTGDPRSAVTGAARREELLQKRKTKKPVKGSITRSVKSPLEGPKSSGVSKVDDLFGMGDAPMGYKYGSRK